MAEGAKLDINPHHSESGCGLEGLDTDLEDGMTGVEREGARAFLWGVRGGGGEVS